MQKRLVVCLLTFLPLILVFGAVSAEFSFLLSDEFNNASTLSDWTALASNDTTATTIDIDTSEADKLVIVPAVFNQNGWFASSIGPYLYKEVTGDFIVTSHIIAGNVNDHDTPPTGSYNSAGFVIRDPASTMPQSPQNWIMYNVGAQVYDDTAGHTLATEAKTTVNSSSVLTLRPTASATSNAGQLALCRSGSTFYAFKWMDDEAGWTLEEAMSRPDLPETLQVGTVVNGWTSANLRAQFDYVRVYTGTVGSSAECLTQLTAPTSVSVVASSTKDFPLSIDHALLLATILTLTIHWKTRLNS